MKRFTKLGKKSIKETKDNFKKIKNKYKDKKSYNIKAKPIKRVENIEKLRNDGTSNFMKNTKKAIKNKAIKSKKSAKTITQSIKAVISGAKAIISLITAGGFAMTIGILIICLLCSVMAIFNSDGDDYTKTMWDSSIVMVAKAQMGVTGGEPYWSWYGFDKRVEWCAIFVSWCADQTGYLDSGEIPRYSVCGDGISKFKEKQKWQDRNVYIPKAGDIIFFDWEVDGECDHTGIVEMIDLENKKVKTIEGNSGDEVKEQSYNLSDARIVGYGTPNYKE